MGFKINHCHTSLDTSSNDPIKDAECHQPHNNSAINNTPQVSNLLCGKSQEGGTQSEQILKKIDIDRGEESEVREEKRDGERANEKSKKL